MEFYHDMVFPLDFSGNLLSVAGRANFFEMLYLRRRSIFGAYLQGGASTAGRKICRPDAGMRFPEKSIVHIKDDADIGVIYFAVDNTRRQYLRGHLSYGVDPAYSGHNYAMKACKLMKPVALAHEFKRLFIGSKHSNIASQKTIAKLGAVPIAASDVPDGEVLKELQADGVDMFVWDIRACSH